MKDGGQTIGVIGLGAMGSRLATNLMAAGYRVVVHNRTGRAAADAVSDGAVQAATPAEAAGQADVLLAAVSDDAASGAVWLDHPAGAVHGLRSDAIAIEASTISPGWARELAGELDARGIDFLEAPMIGSRPQAEARQLQLLVGGSVETLDRVRTVLCSVAAGVHYVGPVGNAATLKLVVNGLLAAQVQAVAELLSVVRRAGLDVEDTVELLASLPVMSPAAQRAAAAMVAQRYEPNFPIRLVAKDLQYLVATASALEAPIPAVGAVAEIFSRASGAGLADQDIVAAARHLDEAASHATPGVVT